MPGKRVGEGVGRCVGLAVVGRSVGVADGLAVGAADGELVGAADGERLGVAVGS